MRDVSWDGRLEVSAKTRVVVQESFEAMVDVAPKGAKAASASFDCDAIAEETEVGRCC
jgi:hypothetical protein